MIVRFIDWLIDHLFVSTRYKLLIQAAIFFIVVSPFVWMSYQDYKEAEKLHTQQVSSRRVALAHLASIMLKEKFDRIVDVGISLSTRVQFRKLIEAEKWDEAIKILESTPKDFPYVDTVGIFDPKGTVMAVTPRIPEAIGQNFAYRDYYQGVSRDWQPYVSEVFKRAPEPRYNVVSIAIPIRSEQKILGILLLTIKLDTILDWAREIDVGSGGFAYFVDRNGHVAGHPKFSSQSEVFNFSQVPAVAKVLKGEKGVEILYNQIEKEEQVSAYEQLPVYGWGVIVQQPTLTAFAARDARLAQLLIGDIVIIAMVSLLAFLIVSFIKTLANLRYQEHVLFESVGDGLVAIDRHWNIIHWNNAASLLTGWQAEEALGKPLRDMVKFIREKDGSENIVFIEETMLYGKPHFMENDTKLVRKDGSQLYVSDSAAPVIDAQGKVQGAVIVFRDISQERELDKMKDDFFSIASHELRTPLTAIRGNTALIQQYFGEQLKDKQLLEMISDIHESSVRLIDLVHDFLDVGRLEQGRIAFKNEPVDLTLVIAEIIHEVEGLAMGKGLSLTFENPERPLGKVLADRQRLKQVIANLLGNAIKFTDKGGITISLEGKDGNAVVRVRDTGIGISANDQRLLFQKFKQTGENLRTRDITKGSGLGLYIAKLLVEGMGGKIYLEKSEVDKGSTFSFTLPIAQLTTP